MKKVFLFFMATAIFLSCSKDENGDNGQQGNGCRVVEIDHPSGGEIVVEYDNQEKVTNAYSDYGRGEIIYERDKIKVKSYIYRDGTLTEEYESVYDLDASNRINSVTSDGKTKTFVYSDNKLTSIHDENGVYDLKYEYDSHGNLTKDGINNYTYIYDLTSNYIPVFSLAIEDFPTIFEDEEKVLYKQGYFGKTPKNRLIRREFTPGTNDPRTPYTSNYTYITDEKGNVTRITENWDGGSNSVNLKYDCD